jgi:hypothetical protein
MRIASANRVRLVEKIDPLSSAAEGREESPLMWKEQLSVVSAAQKQRRPKVTVSNDDRLCDAIRL